MNAIQSVAQTPGNSLEVGVGSGRFAAALGIGRGVDPSPNMLLLAQSRGIDTVLGCAEKLPFDASHFDTVFMITSLCFAQDPDQALREVQRVLKANGALIVAFIPRNSQLGRKYQKNKTGDSLYRFANFISFSELSKKLKSAEFIIERSVQTLLHPNLRLNIEPGHSSGSFVVIRAKKTGNPVI